MRLPFAFAAASLAISAYVFDYEAVEDSPVGPGPNMSKSELLHRMSRALTMQEWTMYGNVSDTLRLLSERNVSYAGRSMFRWTGEEELPSILKLSKPLISEAHRRNPELIVEAACFECVSEKGMSSLIVPPRVFEAFGLKPVNRTFNYTGVLFPKGDFHDIWGPNTSVPDIRQLESKMWFYYLATEYISVGAEALHMGQTPLIARYDSALGMVHTAELFSKIRSFARQNARRGFVLLNSHAYQPPYVHFNFTDILLFDFHAYNSRPKEDVGHPFECSIAYNYTDSPYRKSAGGITTSGWHTVSQPLLVELDNNACPDPGHQRSPKDLQHPWGWDELSWFAHQSNSYRDEWVVYAAEWLKKNSPDTRFQFSGARQLCDTNFDDRPSQTFYYASSEIPEGFGQEAALEKAWAAQM